MAQETIVTDRAAEPESPEWLDSLERGLRAFKDAPSVAPDLPYIFENGTPFVPPAKSDEPFVPDRGFDGPA